MLSCYYKTLMIFLLYLEFLMMITSILDFTVKVNITDLMSLMIK